MSIVLAIDPGSERSAWLVYNTETAGIRQFAITANAELLAQLRLGRHVDVAVVEQIESFGMAVGREVFETVHWSGRFTEAIEAQGIRVEQLPRRAVKLAICHDSRAKDSNIRAALIDRFGGSAARGTRRAPGPLHGISRDVWSALALAVTYSDQAAAR